MIIRSSINCLTVICLPTVCYFSREKPLVKSTAPGSILYHICLRDLFLFAFIFRSIIPKTQKYLAAFFVIYFILCFHEIYLFNLLQTYLSFTREGLTTPLTRQVACVCSLCACTVYILLLGSPTGSITLVSSLREIPTAAVLHHPFLFGEIPT